MTSGMPAAKASDAAGAWRLTAWIAGAFTLVVGLVMIAGHIGTRAEDPLKSPLLKQNKEKLRLNPADEQMKQRIRTLDLQLRQKYFTQLVRTQSGVYLLLGGVAVFVLAATQVARYQKRPPSPVAKPEDLEGPSHAAAMVRWSVAAAGVAIGGLLLAVSFGKATALPKGSAAVEKLLGGGESPALADAASPEELKRNWPRFRGADGSGVSAFTNSPLEWDAKTGKGIAWKVPAPANGFGSPIVWGDRVFLVRRRRRQTRGCLPERADGADALAAGGEQRPGQPCIRGGA